MSTYVEEKLRRETTTSGRAQRDWASLKKLVAKPIPAKAPDVAVICPMETESTWRLIAGTGTGLDARYELVSERRRPVTPEHVSEIELPGNGPAARAWRDLQKKGGK